MAVSNTFPVQWHEQCNANLARAIECFERRINSDSERLARMKADHDLRAKQIEAAKLRGLERFDSSKLLVVKSKK